MLMCQVKWYVVTGWLKRHGSAHECLPAVCCFCEGTTCSIITGAQRHQTGKHFEKKLAEILSHPVNYFLDFPGELGNYKNRSTSEPDRAVINKLFCEHRRLSLGETLNCYFKETTVVPSHQKYICHLLL